MSIETDRRDELDGREQCMAALAYANEVRLAGARLKRRVKAGELATLGGALADPDAAHLHVENVIMARPRWGSGRARRLLTLAAVPERKRVDTLTVRQLGVLAALGARRGWDAAGARR